MELNGGWILVAMVFLAVFIIVTVLIIANNAKKKKVIYSHSQESHSVSVSAPAQIVPVVETPKVEVPQPVIQEPSKPAVKAPAAPILRCHDYFEFPREGGFHVKTCSAPQRDGPVIETTNPKRIFLQWFPVEGAQEYRIYANAGFDVDPNNHKYRWSVSSANHYFESQELIEPVCWSVTVTAVNSEGLESETSAIYSTCQVPAQ